MSGDVGTGGGFVFNAMRPEFCAGPMLPRHCFAFELGESGGCWLDAPDWLPAGSMFQAAGTSDDVSPVILSRRAWRTDDLPWLLSGRM